MRKRYKIIIVLCPSEPKIIKGEYSYYDLEKDKQEIDQSIYLGGEVRMRAAVQIAPRTNTFIVVGGSQLKVNGMKNYLVQELKKRNIRKQPRIIRIESDPDTLGNLMAIKKARMVLGDRVGILTNFYHLPRALRISKEIFPSITFIPLAAEALLTNRQSTYPIFAKEFIFRIFREIDGLMDWENGTYRNQDKTEESEWKFKCYDKELLDKPGNSYLNKN